MKNTILSLFIILSAGNLLAQLYPLKPQLDQIAFSVVNEEGRLGIEYDTLPAASGFPLIQSIDLDNADLVLHYEYKGLNKKYTRDVVKIISIQSGSDRPVTPTRRDLQQQDQAISIKKGMRGTLTWLDLAEEELVFGESYVLTIERNIQLDVNCEDPRPQFKLKEQWPHYAIAAGAITSIGLGQVYRKKKEEEFNFYRNAWREGEDGSTAQPFLDKAEDYDTQAKILTYAGYGVLLADAIWFYIRRKDKKRKQRLFDEYCILGSETSLRVQPIFELNTTSTSTTSTGIQLTLRF